jgi:hypothetical protein
MESAGQVPAKHRRSPCLGTLSFRRRGLLRGRSSPAAGLGPAGAPAWRRRTCPPHCPHRPGRCDGQPSQLPAGPPIRTLEAPRSLPLGASGPPRNVRLTNAYPTEASIIISSITISRILNARLTDALPSPRRAASARIKNPGDERRRTNSSRSSASKPKGRFRGHGILSPIAATSLRVQRDRGWGAEPLRESRAGNETGMRRAHARKRRRPPRNARVSPHPLAYPGPANLGSARSSASRPRPAPRCTCLHPSTAGRPAAAEDGRGRRTSTLQLPAVAAEFAQHGARSRGDGPEVIG